MPYCTPDDLLELLSVPNAAWGATAGQSTIPTEDRVEQIITDQAADIDAWCRNRYSVPFPDPAPAAVRTLCINACLAEILPMVHRNSEEQHKRAERLRKQVDARLAAIAGGEYSIEAGDDASAAAPGGPVIVSAAATARIFSTEDEH